MLCVDRGHDLGKHVAQDVAKSAKVDLKLLVRALGLEHPKLRIELRAHMQQQKACLFGEGLVHRSCLTIAVSSRGERMRASGLLHCGVRPQADSVPHSGSVPIDQHSRSFGGSAPTANPDLSMHTRTALPEPKSPLPGCHWIVNRFPPSSNWASENGLSLETCGRAWVLVTPRSASNRATGSEVIAEPRSAWIVNWPRAMPVRAH